MMARASSITDLPKEVRHWLEQVLTEQNFSGYKAMEEMMREKGFAISKSAIHRYGQKIEKRMAAIKASTEAARIITEGTSDDQDARSEAVIALCQTEIFDAMIAMQEASDESLTPLERMGAISSVAKNVAALTGASIRQKQFKSVVQARAAEAAEKISKQLKKGGMSATTVEEIKRSILGIAA